MTGVKRFHCVQIKVLMSAMLETNSLGSSK